VTVEQARVDLTMLFVVVKRRQHERLRLDEQMS